MPTMNEKSAKAFMKVNVQLLDRHVIQNELFLALCLGLLITSWVIETTSPSGEFMRWALIACSGIGLLSSGVKLKLALKYRKEQIQQLQELGD